MHDTKISSCKYCQCDIEGHQTWSSPQIHCLKRIQRQRMWFQAAQVWPVTGLLPFHGLSICTQQSAHCHLKDVTTNLKNKVKLHSCIVSYVVHPPIHPAASLGVMVLQDISCNCSCAEIKIGWELWRAQNKSQSLFPSLVALRSEMSESRKCFERIKELQILTCCCWKVSTSAKEPFVNWPQRLRAATHQPFQWSDAHGWSSCKVTEDAQAAAFRLPSHAASTMHVC